MNILQKTALLFVAPVMGLATAKAQITPVTATTTLNVKLNPLLMITCKDASVLLEFVTLNDYQHGVSVDMPDHLTVSSLLPYTLNVKSDNATLAGTTTPTESLNAGVVSVAPTTGQTLGGTTTPVTELSANDQALITDGTPALAKKISITYSIADDATLIANEILGKPADTYSSQITYTISSL